MIEHNVLNNLETQLMRAKKGDISIKHFLVELLASDVFMLSQANVSLNEQFIPLLFEREDLSFASIFTDKARTDKHQFKSVIKDSALNIITNMPINYGLVINPGYEIGLEISPQGLINIRNELIS